MEILVKTVPKIRYDFSVCMNEELELTGSLYSFMGDFNNYFFPYSKRKK
jgi:hypothetical protein